MAQLPAYLQQVAGRFDARSASAGMGVPQPPRVSIKDNRFTLVEADGSVEIIGTHDPKFGTYLDAVVVAIAPAKSRIFYAKAWAPNQDNYEPPDCTSSDGVRPDPMIMAPQNDLCSTCEQAKWGSKITAQGKGVPACQEGKKVVLYIKDKGFYILRITPGSFKTWDSYIADCKSKEHEPQFLVTRIIFASQGVLAFGAVAFVTEELMHESNQPEAVKALMTSNAPAQIAGPAAREAAVSPMTFSDFIPLSDKTRPFPVEQPDDFGGMKPQQKRTRRTKAEMEAERAAQVQSVPIPSIPQQTRMITDTDLPRPSFGMQQPEVLADNDLAKAIAEAFAVKT